MLREPSRGLRKRPATAELLGWLIALREVGAKIDRPLSTQSDLVTKTLSALVKSVDDQGAARVVVKEWKK